MDVTQIDDQIRRLAVQVQGWFGSDRPRPCLVANRQASRAATAPDAAQQPLRSSAHSIDSLARRVPGQGWPCDAPVIHALARLAARSPPDSPHTDNRGPDALTPPVEAQVLPLAYASPLSFVSDGAPAPPAPPREGPAGGCPGEARPGAPAPSASEARRHRLTPAVRPRNGGTSLYRCRLYLEDGSSEAGEARYAARIKAAAPAFCGRSAVVGRARGRRRRCVQLLSASDGHADAGRGAAAGGERDPRPGCREQRRLKGTSPPPGESAPTGLGRPVRRCQRASALRAAANPRSRSR